MIHYLGNNIDESNWVKILYTSEGTEKDWCSPRWWSSRRPGQRSLDLA